MCEWRANTYGTAGTVAGDPLPKQLEAGASYREAFYLAPLLMMLADSRAVLKQRKRRISAIVHLGTGGRVRSNSLRIPLEAMRHQYSGVSEPTPSGVGWPGSASG